MITASLEVAGRSIDLKLHNLSSQGARVEGEKLPGEGTELMFHKGELAVAARVVWTQGRQAGIGFAQGLDPVEVLNHVPAPRARIQADFRRPGLGACELSRTERLLAERWIDNPAPPPIGD